MNDECEKVDPNNKALARRDEVIKYYKENLEKLKIEHQNKILELRRYVYCELTNELNLQSFLYLVVINFYQGIQH